MYFFLYFIAGFVTNCGNTLSNYIMKKNMIQMMKFVSHKDNKIVGLWKLSGCNYTYSNNLLTSLCCIPYECKCTYTHIYLYAFTLGQYVATLHFWTHYQEWKNKIVFLPKDLYQVW